MFPEVARRIGAALRARQKRGAYDGVTSAEKLSEALTRDLQATSNDLHQERIAELTAASRACP